MILKGINRIYFSKMLECGEMDKRLRPMKMISFQSWLLSKIAKVLSPNSGQAKFNKTQTNYTLFCRKKQYSICFLFYKLLQDSNKFTFSNLNDWSCVVLVEVVLIISPSHDVKTLNCKPQNFFVLLLCVTISALSPPLRFRNTFNNLIFPLFFEKQKFKTE